MSILIYSGAGQFAALTVLAGGGGALAAIAALLMMNARWLPMGFAIGPSLSGGRARRFLDAQAIVDASFAISSRGDGSFDRRLLIGATLPQVSSWMAGTVAGVVIGADLGEPETLGLDAIFPAFYLALLVEEARGSTAIAAAGAGAVIAAALIPVAPAGISILAASLAALIGLRAR
jgi:predicted branched-subunit amino acid permease